MPHCLESLTDTIHGTRAINLTLGSTLFYLIPQLSHQRHSSQNEIPIIPKGIWLSHPSNPPEGRNSIVLFCP